MSREPEWVLRVASLRDRALATGDIDEAAGFIKDAFRVMDAEGDPRNLVYASLLCVAGEVAIAAGAFDDGAALCNRAYEVARLHEPHANELLAKALRGLADADVGRGWNERARERYAEALALLAKCTHPEAAATRTEIEEVLRSLRG